MLPYIERHITKADVPTHRELVKRDCFIKEGSQVFVYQVTTSPLLESIREAGVPGGPRHGAGDGGPVGCYIFYSVFTKLTKVTI